MKTGSVALNLILKILSKIWLKSIIELYEYLIGSIQPHSQAHFCTESAENLTQSFSISESQLRKDSSNLEIMLKSCNWFWATNFKQWLLITEDPGSTPIQFYHIGEEA